jgi:hypothetical protein
VEGNPSEIALVENLLRQDLTAVEEAEALQRLKTEVDNYLAAPPAPTKKTSKKPA